MIMTQLRATVYFLIAMALAVSALQSFAFKIELKSIRQKQSRIEVGAENNTKMFSSLFSNRYNKKREIFYMQYEEARQRFPNLPFYRRAKEPQSTKSPKRSRKKRRHADYDYDEWIAGHFISIVVRRTVEQWSGSQLMETTSSPGIDVYSWRSWPREEEEVDAEPRRSLRLTHKPNESPKNIGDASQLDTSEAIKWQQQLLSNAKNAKATSSWPALDSETFIDGLQPDSTLECNMCCKRFSDISELKSHSLEDCRKYLLKQIKV